MPTRLTILCICLLALAARPLIGTPELWTGGEESPAKLPAPACS